MKRMLATIALGAAIISAPAVAQAPATDSQRGQFMQRDQTRDQAKNVADMLFQQFDANRDGTLTRAEADQAVAQLVAARGDEGSRGGGRMQRMVERAFGTAPSLTQAQFEAHALARFDSEDANHDGTLTAAERQQARAQRQGGGQ